MLKYIYVFILIIFLFWIKCKLQKNNKIKEDFQTAEQIKLADMFSSSGNSFYDKISKLNSNIKYIDDGNCSMDATTQLKIETLSTVYISLRSLFNELSLDFKNINTENHKLIYEDSDVVFAKIGLGGGNRLSFFKLSYAQVNEIINTSVRDLRQWHI